MSDKIKEIANRIKSLREIVGISAEEAARECGVNLKDYLAAEKGETDFSASFLIKVAELYKVDITDLLTGKSPTLSTYTLSRKGEGLAIERRFGFSYKSLAFRFKNRLAETLIVTAPYSEDEQNRPIVLSEHEGQEFDLVLKGSLKFVINGKEEILNEGDSVYYDSSYGHGMIATGGAPCTFLAVVLKK